MSLQLFVGSISRQFREWHHSGFMQVLCNICYILRKEIAYCFGMLHYTFELETLKNLHVCT